jgi:hypothetical protein
VAQTTVTPTAGTDLTIELALRRVVDTTGYVATEFHQHAGPSPDSPVPLDERLGSMVVEGIEFFASTDHDVVTDYRPLIASLGLEDVIASDPGIEATPFAYGHFQAYPLEVDEDDPTGGAIDWAQGMQGYAMLPGEVWDALRARGAQVIQINHPRSTSSIAGFQAYFDRAGLVFDFEQRIAFGSPNEQPVPLDWLRLPLDAEMYSDTFDALEIWNGFSTTDSDADGVIEFSRLDLVLRDWFNFLSFGKLVAPLGNSDSHTRELDACGLPRTLIRVSDDSAAGLAGAGPEVYASMLGSVQQDLVVTNGPMIAVSADGGTTSAIGKRVAATAGTISLDVAVTSAEWVEFDTIEVFANNTYDPLESGEATALQPIACFTTRDPGTMAATDPCLLAPVVSAGPLTVTSATIGGPGGAARWESALTIDLAAADVPKRDGATGDDAWVVVRVRGQRALFPVLLDALVDDNNLDTLLSGSDAEIAAALHGKGVPAAAFTGPILVDFDADGAFTAPFAP